MRKYSYSSQPHHKSRLSILALQHKALVKAKSAIRNDEAKKKKDCGSTNIAGLPT